MDILGLPHYVFATTADVGDREGAIKMVKALAPEVSTVKAVLGDGGYSGKKFARSMSRMLGADVMIAKRNEL